MIAITITIGGKVVNDLDPKDRDIAMVFQNYALYPSKTVGENLAFPLQMRKVPKPEIEICILAGGLSTRMGKDKARLRLGKSTMLGLIRKTAKATRLKIRVLRRDLVPRCGPLGGIYSCLVTTNADSVIFLACDMPFIAREIIERLVALAVAHPERAIFLNASGKLTFPVVIPRVCAREIALQIEKDRFSLQSLGEALPSKIVRCPGKWLRSLDNINTPDQLKRARQSV